MRTVSRYLLASFVSLFAAILLASLVAIAVIETLVNIDALFQRELGFASALTDLLLRVPATYLRDLLPLTAFAAAFFCLGLPARRSEITALRAGGISPQRAALPLLVTAGIFSAATLIVNETLVLGAARRWNRPGEDAGAIAFRRGSFWYQRGNAIYNVDDADHQAGRLHGVRVFELGPHGRPVRSIRAEVVEIADDHHWRFLDARLRRFDPTNPTRAPAVEDVEETLLDVAAERDLALLSATVSTLSLGDLVEYIAARARDGRDTVRHRAIFHARLAHPLSVLLFALLAIPPGLSVERTRSLAVSAVRGFALVGLFFALRGAGAVIASAGVPGSAPAPWLLLTAFGGYGSWRFARIPR